LWEFIGSLAHGGTTVFFSTHNVVEAERYAERVLVLVDGELLFTGTPAELERAVGGDPRDFEAAFVRFLRDRGH
jgi:ABC-2 type transport system ATP-binding protein